MGIKLKISELITTGENLEELIEELKVQLNTLKRGHPGFNYQIEGNTLLKNITIKSCNLMEHSN